MQQDDANKKALDQRKKATKSDPGKELLESQELERQLREAKEAEAREQRKHEPPSP